MVAVKSLDETVSCTMLLSAVKHLKTVHSQYISLNLLNCFRLPNLRPHLLSAAAVLPWVVGAVVGIDKEVIELIDKAVSHFDCIRSTVFQALQEPPTINGYSPM